jgi:hypothetical protein
MAFKKTLAVPDSLAIFFPKSYVNMQKLPLSAQVGCVRLNLVIFLLN